MIPNFSSFSLNEVTSATHELVAKWVEKLNEWIKNNPQEGFPPGSAWRQGSSAGFKDNVAILEFPNPDKFKIYVNPSSSLGSCRNGRKMDDDGWFVWSTDGKPDWEKLQEIILTKMVEKGYIHIVPPFLHARRGSILVKQLGID